MSIIVEGIVEGGRAVGGFIVGLGRAIFYAITTSSKYTKNVFVYHLDTVLDKIIGRKLLNSTADAELGIIGQLILFLPVVLPAWIIATTIVPLALLSSHKFLVSFVKSMNLSLSDLPRHEQISEFIPLTLPWYSYIYTIPGYFLGITLGLAAAGVITIPRIINNILKSVLGSTIFIMNLALLDFDEKKKIPLQKENRGLYQRFLGLPGLIIGLPFGLSGFAVVTSVRILINSSISTGRFVLIVTNFAGSETNFDMHIPLAPDARNIYSRILGLPGVFIGSLFGLVGFAAVTWFRILLNSFNSTVHFYKIVKNKISFEPPHPVQNDHRTLYGKFLGLPGFFLGTTAALVHQFSIVCYHFIEHNFNTLRRTFAKTIDLSLEQSTLENKLGQDTRHWFIKYIVGIPGLILGGSSGLVIATAIVAFQNVFHSFNSWKYLSGSLLNLAIGMPYFQGMSADPRNPIAQRKYGPLGFALALCTTGVIGLAYVSLKNAFIFAGFCIALAASVIVAPSKAIKMIRTPRFKSEEQEPANDEEQGNLQKFKNIYSSLNAFGNLPENKDILTEQYGGKGAGCFIRKSVTLNVSSVTERTLDSVLTAYQHSANKSTFFGNGNQEFETAIRNVKTYYKNLDTVFQSSEEISNRESQIDDIKGFVQDYMLNKAHTVPENLYKNHQYSIDSIFWGRKRLAPHHQEEEHPAPGLVA